ncbi:MAG: glycosyltransferase, partial [Xanthomonadaceae bacterium]|nr:glycosyltransferase [Rhodospirillaceae bacterium]NIA18089.1 glycosyltransferase [Xanthomonadaceae bacterium]
IVASGGPELKKIKKIAKNCNNIKILGWISDKKLLELLGNCLATIYIPIREDFGMSPVESMMAGKPVIGVNEGGIKETIIHQKTGFLLKPDFNINDIMDAVKKMTPDRALKMRFDCEIHAKLFSKQKFIENMKKVIKNYKLNK